jgi:P4 family phage/plasmid primase-like protien
MNKNPIIKDKESFQTKASQFLETLFGASLKESYGDIEIRIFPKIGNPDQWFLSSVNEAVQTAYEVCNRGIDVYFGVNPRTGGAGKKQNVHYVSAFHAEIDYGTDGHKTKSKHETYEEACDAICSFSLQPTLVNVSGGGLHCYWVLNKPIKVDEVGVEALESINKELTEQLGGDRGTHNLDRVLRIPGTFNFKLPNKPRGVNVFSSSGPKYDLTDFAQFVIPKEKAKTGVKPECSPEKKLAVTEAGMSWAQSIDNLPVSDRVKTLIKKGNDGSYPSRSEADMAVIVQLVNRGLGTQDIKSIFLSCRIGEKYREHKSPDAYLEHSIQNAKEMSDLTEQEMQDPLFISGSVVKQKNKYKLDIIKFQEYIVRKYKQRILDNVFHTYTGLCYEGCTEDELNNLCQKELGMHRGLFTKNSLKEFIHFAIGYALEDREKAAADQLNYLTLQNGLFNLEEERLIPHTPTIFTTNLLPYDYDPNAQCPRFLQFLDEIFSQDAEKISFVQEAIGYGFHKGLPMPAIFFLVGSGSNGKSVLINVITHLYGKQNTSTISLNLLSKENYILELFGKMVNVSNETPRRTIMKTDVIKAVVAGDWVTGREIYKRPVKFKPFAKHYLAMNETPSIDDPTHGMWRRVYLIDFTRTFSEKEMDMGLTEKLINELSGIFNWTLEGYKRLRTKDFRFTQSDQMLKSKLQLRKESNSALSFVSQYLRKSGPEERIKWSKVYEYYKHFCSHERYEPMSKFDLRHSVESIDYVIRNSSKDNNQLFIFGAELIDME